MRANPPIALDPFGLVSWEWDQRLLILAVDLTDETDVVGMLLTRVPQFAYVTHRPAKGAAPIRQQVLAAQVTRSASLVKGLGPWLYRVAMYAMAVEAAFDLDTVGVLQPDDEVSAAALRVWRVFDKLGWTFAPGHLLDAQPMYTYRGDVPQQRAIEAALERGADWIDALPGTLLPDDADLDDVETFLVEAAFGVFANAIEASRGTSRPVAAPW